MLDGRVLAAVLASVAAIAAGINGGGVAQSMDADRVKSSSLSAPGGLSFSDVVPDSLSSLKQFVKNPEPENSVKAHLVAEDISDEKLNVKGASLTAGNFTSLSFGGKTARSSTQITVYGFTGNVEPDDITNINGRASGFRSNNVNVSGNIQVQREIETRVLELEGVERTRLNLEEATGVIEANSSSTDIREAGKVRINSFSGDMTVFPMNGSIVIEGKVDRLDAGTFSFGG